MYGSLAELALVQQISDWSSSCPFGEFSEKKHRYSLRWDLQSNAILKEEIVFQHVPCGFTQVVDCQIVAVEILGGKFARGLVG